MFVADVAGTASGAGVAAYVPAITAFIAVVGAIAAALIQGKYNVAAQNIAQAEISRRDVAKQDLLDRAVRRQVIALFDALHSRLSIIATSDHPVSDSAAVDYAALHRRIFEVDVAMAFSSDSLGRIFAEDDKLRRVVDFDTYVASLLEHDQDVPAKTWDGVRGAALSGAAWIALLLHSLEDADVPAARALAFTDKILKKQINGLRERNNLTKAIEESLLRDLRRIEEILTGASE